MAVPSLTVRLAAAALVAGMVAAPAAANAAKHRIIEFEGQLNRDEAFSYEFLPGYRFELRPIEHGWEIAVRDARRPGENLARLTPPFHFVPNPRFIEGWHFRNADNTGPNELPSSVNAPQLVRDFVFSPRVGVSIHYPPDAGDVERIRDDGHGTLVISQILLGNLTPGERATIRMIRFRVRLEVRF